MDVWGCCTAQLTNYQNIELTNASQHLFRVEHEYLEDAPSPLTDSGEDEATQVVESTEDSQTVAVRTIRLQAFHLQHQKHKKLPVPFDEEEAYAWTEYQRHLARMAEQPFSLADLRHRVGCLTFVTFRCCAHMVRL